ncbi:MAG: hypothetical protein JKY37_07415 [Nannocystaceae bacterium]|nr:hypothetical protein [Nannocystaceae bacterium]
MTRNASSYSQRCSRAPIRLGATLTALVLATMVVAVPGDVRAAPALGPTDPEASTHFRRGVELFNAGDFEGAVAQYEAGFAIEDHPLSLYSMAQAETKNDNCPRAVKLFKEFIAADVPDKARDNARGGMLFCAEILADAGIAAAPTDDPVDDPVDEPIDDAEGSDDDPRPRDGARKWYLDPAGDGLVAFGVVGVGVGVGLIAGAGVLAGQPQPPGYADHVDRLERIQLLRTVGGITAGVGGALLIGGVVRWVIVSRRGGRASNVGLLWHRGVAGLQVSGRF